MAQKPSQPTYSDQDVQDVADTIIKNPGVPVDTTNFPDGMSDAVVNEVNLRQQHHQDIQDALNKQTDSDKENAENSPSVLTPGADRRPMAGLLGAADSLTLGHTDELAGLIGAMDGNGYAPVRDAVRAKQDWAKEHNPKSYYGMNILGSTQLPGPRGSGAAIGAVAGEGYSKKSASDPSLQNDAALGGLFGGAVEGGLQAGGALVKKGLSQLAKNMDSSFWDPVLLRALFPGKGGSEELSNAAANDSMADNPNFTDVGPGTSDIAQAVRANAKFPYLSPQSTKNAINGSVDPSKATTVNIPRGAPGNPLEPAPPWQSIGKINATELPGSSNVPPQDGAWTPQSGPPKEIQMPDDYPGGALKAYRDTSHNELSSIMPNGPAAGRYNPRAVPVKGQPAAPQNVSMQAYGPPSEVPPISPAERVATQGLSNMSDAPSNGMDPSTMQGGMSRMLQKNIVGPTAIGIPKAGQAMLRYLDSNPGDYGTKAAMLKGVINHVMSSTDPSFSDYLAKETFPEYLALSMKAEKDNPQESNKPSDTPQQKGFGQSR